MRDLESDSRRCAETAEPDIPWYGEGHVPTMKGGISSQHGGARLFGIHSRLLELLRVRDIGLNELSSGSGVGIARGRQRGAWPGLSAGILVLLLSSFAFGGYYEFKNFDHDGAYKYLDEVEGKVGMEEFEKVPYSQAFAVALPLGRIDHWYLTPQTFMSHVKQTQVARSRFYREQPLTDEEVKNDLLALRIRYESTANADWMERIAKQCGFTAKAKTADEAAAMLFDWMRDHLQLTGSALGYKLPLRGDLDPITVLKDGRGSEIDLAICGVALLRASGVVSRIVYAPALRGETGGKVWLEYMGENRVWQPWVPSFGKAPDHLAEIRRRFGGKIVQVMARPEAPQEITERYVDTALLEFKTGGGEVEISLLVFGREGLMMAAGNEVEDTKKLRSLRVGKGLVVASASFGNRSFALLPIEIPQASKRLVIIADGSDLRIEAPPSASIQKPDNP